METKQLMQAKLWVIGLLAFGFIGMTVIAGGMTVSYLMLKYDKGSYTEALSKMVGGNCKINKIHIEMLPSEVNWSKSKEE